MTGDELRCCMRALGQRERSLADLTGCNIRTVRRWKAGDLPVPRYVETIIVMLSRLARAQYPPDYTGK
jgi:hypothetical protein